MKRPRAAGIMARAGAVPFWGLLGAVLAIPLLAGPAGAQQPPPQAVRQIKALLAEKAQRTPAQRKVSSQFLEAQRTPPRRTVNRQLLDEQRTPTRQKLNSQLQDALRAPLQKPTAAGASRLQTTDLDAKNERVMVDIRADVTPAVLTRIRELGGTVIASVSKYQAIRAQIPLRAVVMLAALDEIRTIRPADEARTRGQVSTLSPAARTRTADFPVTRKANTSEGDVAHRANSARRTHKVDGTGIGIGVISDGVRSLADRQASGDLPARVTVLPGQEGRGDEGTALLEIVHDLAPGAELYFATGFGGEARMAENIEALCEAGANVIVDDIGYALEAVFQDGIVSKGVNAAVTDGCFFFSAGGNDGNLTYGTTGVWEGDYAAGTSLIVDGETLGVRHDFGGGMEANEVSGSGFSGVSAIVLQWADPLGASTNDYDLFLINEDGDVVASSTDTQDGTQDPIESIRSFFNYSGLSVVIVKASGSDRYLRVHAFDGRLEIQTAGNLYGHAAAENAVVVAMVNVRTAAGTGGVFNGTESVRTDNSDGPRRIFFQPDGTAIKAGNFSSTGGKLLQKPDLTAATCVSTATPGFSTFCGTSAAAPHAAAIAALMLAAAGGPNQVTLARVRKGMTTGTAVLDIEATGVDRDSGAGIVMAPGAVDAVDVAVADRNGAPTVENAESDRTLTPGGDAVDIDLADVFDDPDDDTLTYEAVSSDPDRLTITRSNAQVTITPGSPGRVVVRLRAIDPDGLSATDAFSVTVSAGSGDYDADNDGFIEVANLAQLDALRYDLNGDGLVDGATWMPYYSAYPMGALGMGCPSEGCKGYELTANLDFDTDDSGDADVGDTYWNGGDGWAPIGDADAPFTADFMGNRHTVSNLFIDRHNEDEVGLFGTVDSSRISGVTLAGADVSGRHAVGSLLGDGVYGTVIDNHATGQVSGQDEVGGLVGRTWGTVWYSSAAVNVSGNDAVGGLVGHQTLNDTVASYATGNVEGMDAVGGLVGAVSDVSHVIEASYATGNVSGTGARLAESDSGFIICDFVGAFTTSGPVETKTSTGGGVGGLVGSSCGWIEVSYATGAVSGTAAVGGLVGSGRFARAQSAYWDLETSGVRVGVGEDDANDNGVIDGAERLRLGVGGKTTAELQTPTDYTGVYEAWNVELGDPIFDDGEVDDPWDFGTTAQYPVLSLDLNDDNRATWEEFGYQVRTSLTLTAATTASQAQVVLSWDAISTTSWSPAPDVSYTLYRDDGATIEAIETNLAGLTHTDTGVTIGDRYTYWVAAVLDGGEAVRSAPVSVTAGGANQPPAPVGVLADRTLTVGATPIGVDVAAAFQDPDNDPLTYGASSSLTSVATLSRSGSVVTITPVAVGRTIITVTATDAGGSNMSASQRFRVTVGHDYDTDGDGLIGISTLAQLDAMRYDLDGNGYAGTSAEYAEAFPSPLDRMGCGLNGCSGYELLADLDFDTDGDGAVDSDDDYWNDGDGWEPIGWDSTYDYSRFFNATFDGNEHTLSNLFTTGRGYSGLFGRIGLDGEVHDLTLSDVNVTGTEAAGALVGENQGLLIGIQSSGQVSGELHVGGLVGLNLRLVYLAHSSAAVTGKRPPRVFPPGVNIIVTFGPPAATGGLVGYNTGYVVYSYATGPVTSDSDAGGLVGYHQSKLIAASYATGPVSGSSAGGLVGTVATPREEATIRASYATGSVDGGTAGGLVGHVYDEGMITASYATGRVDGSSKGGLVGDDDGGTVTNSYWDTHTSGHTSGSPGSGRTTSQLQSPTGYSGIYGSWNLDLNDDGTNNDPWHFETGKYPALKADMDGDDDATWEEFGYQLRSGPTLTATPTTNAGQSQVELEWTEVALSSAWTPAPGVSYAVTREDDEDLETIAENLTVLEYTDTDVAGETYVYQVVAVVDGGEPVRSATASVTVAGNKRPVAVGRLRWRTLLVGDSAMTEVGGAFQDPEGDTITYAVSSSDTSVARVTLSGSRVTIIPVAEGRTFITVTATDEGSNRSRTQQFWVTVRPTTTVDYDTDDDGLIEIRNLAQLDAVRYDNGGRGSGLATAHREAFTDGGGGALACGGLLGCVGYELLANLDFDTDRDGTVDSDDDYWNNGAGWMPIKTPTIGSITPYSAIFEGNGHTITNLFIDSSENDIGLFGETTSSAVIRNLELVAVQVTGTDNVGGLVGSNGGAVSGCYATGKVSGDDDVGGLVGANWDDGFVLASYSTVQVTGDDRVGGLAGSNRGEVTAAYATGRVVGDFEAGGLIGRNNGDVNVSYATGLVSGRSTIGGLIGWNASGGAVTDSFWDSDTSGRTTGFSGQAKTTAELQLPTAASGIYSTWNPDLDGDSMNDDPWDFGTSSQYPVLSVDTNGVGGATWQEFGQQVQTSPALMPTTALGQVTLAWSAVSSAAYNLFRTSGTTVEILTENTANRTYVDTDVTAGATYVYQVAAVINGGEASRSPRVSVDVPVMGTLPTVALQLMPTSIGENGGSATVTARLSLASTETTTVTVSATAVTPAVSGDFSLSTNTTLTITAGQSASTGTVTITANNNGVDAPNKTVMVMGTASNSAGVTGPSDMTLTIIDDDATPVITTAALIPVAENETVVATLQATDEDDRTEDLEWAITGGADRSHFRLTAGGRLAFTAAKDYEEPDDNDRDGDYQVTVQVSDGFNAVEVEFTVRLQDVDDTAPTVSKIEITSDPGTDRTYAIGHAIGVTVTFSETVEVTGRARLQIELGGGSRTATYEGGSGTAALVFEYEVAEGESDIDGVGVEADSLSGGTIRDEASNDAELDHDGLAADAGHKVDGVKPELAASGGAVVDGTTLRLTYDEPLDGSPRPETGDFTVSGGDQARTVTGVRVNGSAVVLTLDAGAEHLEAEIQVSYTPGTNPIRDAAGNQAEALSREPVTNETPDTTPPEVESLGITSNPGSDQTYAAEDEIEVRVTFSETVEVEGTPQLRLRVGSRTRTAGYLRGADTAALVFGYEVADGDEDSDGVSIEANRLTLNGGTIKDEGDNPAELAHEAVAAQAGHQVDGVRPAFVSAAVDGSSLTLTYGEALDGSSRPATGDFTVEVDGSGRSVSGVSVSGSEVTLFLNPAVVHGDTGVRVSYTVPTGVGANPIQDEVGNQARGLSNRSVTNTTGAPNTAPEITSPSSFDVPENQAVARRLAARDSDPGDEVTGWAIVGGADRFQFSIAPDTGELSFREVPDFESPADAASADPLNEAGDNQYVVAVEVTSGAGARELTAEQTLAVRVTDEREPPGVPEAPMFSGETADSLRVSWSEPDNTGPPITDYDVQVREEGTGGFTGALHEGPGRTLTLSDLEAGTLYQVQVRATNEEGTSGWSVSGEGMTVTPLTVGMASGAEPPVSGPFTVRFSFSEPVTGFSASDIDSGQDPACRDDQNNTVFCDPGIGTLQTTDDRVFTATVTPWTDRVAHSYTLRLTVPGGAVRSLVGSKPNEEPEEPLEVRVAPPGVTEPISSLGLTASGGNGSVRLSWNRPSDSGGSAIIRYEYRYQAVGEAWSEWENVGAGTRSVTVGNLVNGREYVFEVRAVNALGKGGAETVQATPELRIVPPRPPPAPRPPGNGDGGGLLFPPEAPAGLMAMPGEGAVRLEWSPPESDGGTPILRYEYRLKEGLGEFGEWTPIEDSGAGEVNAAGYTVGELGKGTVYVFELRAVNLVGNGRVSEAVEVVMGLDRAYWSNFRGEDLEGAEASLEWAPFGGTPRSLRLRFGAGLRFEESELDGEGEVRATRMGGYGYRYTSQTTGELRLDYDGGETCELRMTFRGVGAGSYSYRCGGALRGQGSFRLSGLNRGPEITGAGVFEVAENQARVGRLEAVDPDEGDGIEGYGIAGGADASLFVIEAETGELRFREAPDYENPSDVESAEPRSGAGDNEYIVVVEVRSGEGERERKGSRAIRVRVTDEQEPPEITSLSPFEVVENRTRVGQLEAVDQDKQDEITEYGIAGGADGGLFAVEAETGELRFREAPDYENPGDVESAEPESGAGDNEYIVVVEVRSGEGERERRGSRAIRVRVSDEEEPPEITSVGPFEVAENQAMVGQLEAVDQDKQDEITGYGIAGGADGALFAVEAGELRFREAPDYENPGDVESSDPESGAGDNEYVVVVEVRSGEGERERRGSRAIRVRVSDEEEPPEAPGAPAVTAEGSGSLKVSWREPENRGPEIVDYEVRYREGGEEGYSDGGHQGTGLEVRLSGLKEGTVYEVQVRAVNQEGMSEWSEPGEGRTDREEADPEEPDPDDPSDFTEGDLEGRRLRLRLEGEEGTAGSLELRFGEGNRFEQIESGGQQAATRSEGASRSGSYTYERTGPGMGTVRLDYDDGSSCEIRLSFTGTGVGGFAYDCGEGAPAEGSFRLTTGSLFVPVILSAAGQNRSFFTSELTLTNRGDGEVKLDYTYTAHRGGGSGKTSDVLAPGIQKIETDALTYLRGLGIAIPETGNRIGTLRVEARLGSEVEAVVRTTTVVPEGRAGLAYLGVAEEEGFDEAVYLCGLRQNSRDRSNLAFQNMGAEEEGAITLRTTVYSGEAADATARILEDVRLEPGGFHQYSGLLGVLGVPAQGYVRVERVEGTSPFYAYGVINDQANSDGSFIFPVAASWLEGRMGQTLPVIVETSAFRSELTVTNFSEEPRRLDFRFVADAIKTTDKTAGFSMKLEAGEQRIIPEVVEELRRQEVAGLGSTRGFYAGAVFATAEEGNMSGIVIGARTGSEGGGGSYSVFYNAVPFGEAFTEAAWVEGLQQNRKNRSNLALVNTGEVDGSASVFHLEIYDGETGLLAETVVTKPIPARRWHQIDGILRRSGPETRQGYIRIEKVSGENPFLAYGVVNDGGAPGERSGDGAYLPARE